MNIKIISDSTCDLSAELIAKYNIDIVPLFVMKNDEEFEDGVTITSQQIFDHVAAGGSLCSTAARSMVYYQEVFAKYADSYDGIIHINIGSQFSSSYQNACLAAMEFDNVRCIDSNNLTTGQGLVVLKACELAPTAQSLDVLAEELVNYSQKIETSFLVDKLDYLAKGGRCSSAAALGANLLNLKPCIEVKDGKMTVVKKYRGSFAKCLSTYVKDRLADREDVERKTLFITQAVLPEDCHQAVMEAVETYGNFETVYETYTGCTVSCHCGPGTLGIIFVRK